VLRTAAATLAHTFYVDETPTDPTGTPTYVVEDVNGTQVATGDGTVVTGEGRVTATLAGQSTLTRATVTWSATVAGTAVIETDQVEIVGGRFFTLVEGRGSDASLADSNKYTTADLVVALLEVEQECETICDRAFVPRYERVVLDGTGTRELVVRHPDPVRSFADIRSLRRVAVAPRYGEAAVDLTSGQLGAVAVTQDAVLLRTDGLAWTEGRSNVVVELEYGWDAPPTDLVRAAKRRFRYWLNANKSGVPDRAVSFTAQNGATYRIDLPDAWKTGIPDVDAAYSRYSRRQESGTDGRAVPASRSLDFNPQRDSLFHGGVR